MTSGSAAGQSRCAAAEGPTDHSRGSEWGAQRRNSNAQHACPGTRWSTAAEARMRPRACCLRRHAFPQSRAGPHQPSMQGLQDWRKAGTRSWLGSGVHLAAFVTHILLALYQQSRRLAWRLPVWEAAQIVTGLSVPLFLNCQLIVAADVLARETWSLMPSPARTP